MNNSLVYKIPNRKKWLLTDAFLQTFKEELDNEFNYKESENSSTYCNSYIWLGGTAGFQIALKSACEKHNISKALYEYSCGLPWHESDTFDEEVFEIMLERNIIEMGNRKDLYGGYPTEEDIAVWDKNGEIEWIESVVRRKGYNVITRDWIFTDK